MNVVINKQEVQFSTQDNQTFCTSLDVARVFGKQHKHILVSIERILSDLREIGASNGMLNFRQVVRTSQTTNPKNGKIVNRKMPMYNLTRDGFSLLAMGFTGKTALQWKIAFLNAFNEMERLLKKELLNPNKYIIDLMALVQPNLPQSDYKISVIITDKPHSKEAKNIFSLDYLVDNRTPKDPKIINNPTPKSEKDYIAGKKLNEKKMGEVGIRKDENISKIFHANEKRLKNLELMAKKDVVADGRNAHTSYTQAQSLDGRLVQKNISSTANEIIPQQDKSAKDFKSKLKEFNTKNKTQTQINIKELKR
mgnify:CR=1 FL=1